MAQQISRAYYLARMRPHSIVVYLDYDLTWTPELTKAKSFISEDEVEELYIQFRNITAMRNDLRIVKVEYIDPVEQKRKD